MFGEPKTSKLVGDKVPILQLPFMPSVQENVLFDHEVFDKLVDIIVNTPVSKTSFIERVKEAISKDVKDTVVKVLAYLIVKAQKEVDVSSIASKYGFTEQRPFVLTITDDSGENVITRVVMRVKDGKLVVVTKPDKVDFEIVTSYRTLARMLLGKARVGNKLVDYDPVDSWLKGDTVVYGMGSVPRILSVFKSMFMEKEFIEDVRSKYGKVLEGWI